MELGLRFTELTCWEKTGHVTVTHEETMETAIAEYCPDMTRIVTACGQVLIRERTVTDTGAAVSGTVRVTVLYTSEESAGLRSLTLPVPFSCTAEDRQLAASQVLWATGRLLLMEAQAVTARKLYIRVLPEVTLTGLGRCRRRLCCGTEQEDPTLRVKERERRLDLLEAAAERELSITQETQVQPPMPEELLLYRLYPRLTSCRLVGNKLVVKGEVTLSALYRGQDQQLHTYEVALPLSQILDGAGLPEDGEYTGRLRLAGGEVRVLRSDNGGGFSVSAELRLLLCAYRSVPCTCLEDLYSVHQPVRLEQETAAIPLGRPCRSVREETAVHLDFGGKPFFFITDTDCTPAAVTEEGGQTALRTTVRTRLLYLDETDTPAVTERTAEVVAPTKGEPGGVSCALAGSPEAQFGSGGCDVRQVVEFLIEDAGPEPILTVSGAELLEEQEERRPSLVLRRLLPEETLWDVAKQYRTDETLLRTVNQLEDDVHPEKMLLIPRVR